VFANSTTPAFRKDRSDREQAEQVKERLSERDDEGS
jgi:hypothetical protein